MDKRVKWIASVFCAFLMMSAFGLGTAKASEWHEWTQNSTFLLDGYKWDPILYRWNWVNGHTEELSPSEFDDLNYALWEVNGVAQLGASDPNSIDGYGRSARFTYGPFEDVSEYPELELPTPLRYYQADSLILEAVVSNYGSINADPDCWTGIKFDAWFKDPNNDDRPLMIEMYFHTTGFLQGTWGNEHFRTMPLLGGTIDDYMVKLQGFSDYCTMEGDIPTDWAWFGVFYWTETVFTIDLKAFWRNAKSHFGRSPQDELYAVALDVETCSVVTAIHPVAFAKVNEIRVTWLSGGGGGGGGWPGPIPCPWSSPCP